MIWNVCWGSSNINWLIKIQKYRQIVMGSIRSSQSLNLGFIHRRLVLFLICPFYLLCSHIWVQKIPFSRSSLLFEMWNPKMKYLSIMYFIKNYHSSFYIISFLHCFSVSLMFSLFQNYFKCSSFIKNSIMLF